MLAQYTKRIRPIITKVRQYATVTHCYGPYIIPPWCGMRPLPWRVNQRAELCRMCYAGNRMRKFRDSFLHSKQSQVCCF